MRIKERGITLIALVVTIVVLLILAAVSVNLLLDENGVINRAKNAKAQQQIAEYIERINLARASVAIDNYGTVTLANLIDQIVKEKIVARENIVTPVDGDDIKAKITTPEGYIFIITATTIEYQEGSGGTGNSGSSGSGSSTETESKLITSITLNETQLAIEKGNSVTLTPTISPADATNQNLSWSSNNEDVATVENGVITPQGVGTATITATAQDGSNQTVSCEVTVTVPLSALKAGDYIIYDAGTTYGEIVCRVLYPTSSTYGLEIISNEKVQDVSLGGETVEAAIESYNRAVTTLNSKAELYLNATYATDARSVGSNPIDKTTEMPTNENGYKTTDTWYTEDIQALENANILASNSDYWLASRELLQGNESNYTPTYLYVRDVVGIYNDSTLVKMEESKMQLYYKVFMGDGADLTYYEWVTSATGTKTLGLRPCITLKSDTEIKITSGNGKTQTTAYRLGVIE